MKRMILIDGNSLMYRAYYGMAAGGAPQANSKGLYTNAIYAFARMINHVIKLSNYDNILVAFDAGKKTLRHEWMTDYKAGRAPMPDEFRMQIAYIKQFLDIMRIKQYEQDLYEADDIIGTMSKIAEDNGYHVDIFSSDKDLLQLVSENTTVHLNKKGMTELEDYTPELFYERYQINYNQFIDLKAMMGDKSDNLPGIPGVGEKKAVTLLQQYGTLDNIIEHRDEIKGALGKNVQENYESAKLCQKMATIIRDFDIKITLDDTKKQEPDKEKLIAFYKELEFKSLLKDIEVDAPKIIEDNTYKIVNNPMMLDDILLPNSALIFETFEYNYHRCPILAIGIKNGKGTFIIPPDMMFNNMSLMMYLGDENIKKSIYDYKRAYVLCKRVGIDLRGVDFDLLLATYILRSTGNQEEFKYIASYYDYDDVYLDEEIYGKGVKKAIPEQNILYTHIAKKANALFELKDKSVELLTEKKQLHLLTNIEIPLSRVLGKMEFNGIKVDINELHKQKEELEIAITELEKKIYNLAGHEFNISSPKQLGTVLFDELNIPYPKKKGNSYSTDIDILNAVKLSNPIIDLVIEYRAKTKLYSTYVIGINDYIYPDGKVHTIFQQALTATGRLSSIDPNLQNIPIRTPEGHLIRKMFVPEKPGNKLYSSDYSQIELRVLAHMADVKKLKEAFINGEDIHTKTAKEVFKKDEITPLDRRHAKAVNFGIVYGISAFGLAQDLGISNYEASEFIKKYYEAYPEIKTFMDKIIDSCKENGYVSTMENRIRYVPEINSKIFMQREFAKRVAMNTPIQGSAADIIKIAMINVDNEIEKRHLKSKMIVQVHDELVFEVESGEEEILQSIVKEKMENAYKMNVPLVVDDSFGNNWYEVK
ncbi:MAG: DNA polymerase I [Acholeplasmatales bacterium]|nr:DNA polymerase I [Acholeplasmatales bacterium]